MDPAAADPQSHFTDLFNRAIGGDRPASNLLYQAALPRLIRIAAGLLHSHRKHETLPPTALVNESWLKVRGLRIPILAREQFFRISAHAMRQVLIDHGRSKSSRQAYLRHAQQLADRDTPVRHMELVIAREVLDRFEKIDPSAARIIRLRYISGHSWDEISREVGRPAWRVRDDATFALTWMRNHLS
jgi:RNA polymerase sigma factor (TIGR02999 family)